MFGIPFHSTHPSLFVCVTIKETDVHFGEVCKSDVSVKCFIQSNIR